MTKDKYRVVAHPDSMGIASRQYQPPSLPLNHNFETPLVLPAFLPHKKPCRAASINTASMQPKGPAPPLPDYHSCILGFLTTDKITSCAHGFFEMFTTAGCPGLVGRPDRRSSGLDHHIRHATGTGRPVEVPRMRLAAGHHSLFAQLDHHFNKESDKLFLPRPPP